MGRGDDTGDVTQRRSRSQLRVFPHAHGGLTVAIDVVPKGVTHMKKMMVLAAVAALCVVGCKKKNDASSGGGSGATATAPAAAKANEPAPAGAKAKTCEEQGGTKQGDSCEVKTPAPIDVVFEGKFDTDMMHPDPGAEFKVTNKLAVPVKVNTTQIYAYDKTGKQLDLDLNGSKSKYSQESQGGLIELDPNESKEYVTGLQKKMLPADMDTMQAEIMTWSVDGQNFHRAGATDDVRPKDGWK